MRLVKTIRQYAFTYEIFRLGDRSFRIKFYSDDNPIRQNVEKIYETMEECEAFVSAFEAQDKFIAPYIRTQVKV